MIKFPGHSIVLAEINTHRRETEKKNTERQMSSRPTIIQLHK